MYISTAGSLVQSARQEIIANNLANVNTSGFRRQMTVFSRRRPESEERNMMGAALNPLLEKIDGGVYIYGMPTIHEGGALIRSDDPYDFAISGEGFFICEDANGERFYTRAGNFLPNKDKDLGTPDGKYFLLDPYGNRIKSEHPDDINMESIKAVTFEDLDKLRRVGDSMFSAKEEPLMAAGEVRRGYYEASNVSPIVELISMIEGFRVYEANMQAIRSQDRTLGRAVNDVGRVNR
jgi:flagellar basal-body rod protein FlgG